LEHIYTPTIPPHVNYKHYNKKKLEKACMHQCGTHGF